MTAQIRRLPWATALVGVALGLMLAMQFKDQRQVALADLAAVQRTEELVAQLAAAEALRRAAARIRPFRLEVAGLGAFPSAARPSVLWAGTGDGRERLVALAREVEAELSDCGFPPEERPFQPHLTLGRVRRGALLGSALRECLAAPAVSYGAWSVERLVLMRSDLMPAGPRYSVLEAAELMRGE